MSMNEITISGSVLLFSVAAMTVGLIVYRIYDLQRQVRRHQRALELGERDLKALKERFDYQQLSIMRLDQEVMDMRQTVRVQAAAFAMPRSQDGVVRRATAPATIAAPVHSLDAVRASQTTTRERTGKDKSLTRATTNAQSKSSPAAKIAPINPVELARTGVKVDVLMSRCGLSRAEADLVLSVHGGAAVAR